MNLESLNVEALYRTVFNIIERRENVKIEFTIKRRDEVERTNETEKNK